MLEEFWKNNRASELEQIQKQLPFSIQRSMAIRKYCMTYVHFIILWGGGIAFGLVWQNEGVWKF